jgi:MFS family permease
MRAGWALLRRRDFGLLWAGGLISETGDWFLLVGLPIWVLQITGSSLVTATVFLVGLLPGLVVGPLAGVLVDRWDRRRTLVAVSLGQAAFLLPLLAVHDRGDLWIVYAVMAVEASLGQLNDPARNALVPSLVGGEDLVGANALIGLNSNLARLVGSPLGGILVELSGLPGLVIGDAASFLLGAALIGLVGPRHRKPSVSSPLAHAGAPHPHPPDTGAPAREGSPTPGPAVPVVHRPTSPSAGGVGREWLDGLRVTLGDRELRWGLVVNGLAAVAQGIFTVLFVVFVTRALGGDGADVGLLRGVQAIGGLLGGVLVVGMARRLRPGRLLGTSLVLFALIDLAIWNGPVLTTATWLYLGLFVAAGIPGVGVLTGLTALVQERAGDAYLGRVFATYLGSFNGLMALGMLLAGVLGDAVGVVTVLNGQAVLYLLAGMVAVATLSPRPARYPRTSKRARMPLA